MPTATACTHNVNGQRTEIDAIMTAAHRVFGTYELLEAIIVNLPPEDILLATKLNTTAHSIVCSSPAIRKHLQDKDAFSQGSSLYTHRQNLRNCMVVIHLRRARIVMVRAEDNEVVAVLPALNHHSPVPARPVIVDGKPGKLNIMCLYLYKEKKQGKDKGKNRLILGGSGLDWSFEFWSEHEMTGWNESKGGRGLGEFTVDYLEKYHVG